MNILKLWYIVCLAFGFQSLNSLVEESHEVVYEKSKSSKLWYLSCKELSWFRFSKIEFELEELRDELYLYFNSSFGDSESEEYRLEFDEVILENLKSELYLIQNDLFCFIADDLDELLEIDRFLPFQKVYFAFNGETLDLFKMAAWNDRINQLTVSKLEYPYSDCSKFAFRYDCLNDCFKKKFRLSRYFYEGGETGLIYVNQPKNRSIEENEKNCFRECKRENCKLVQLIPANPLSLLEVGQSRAAYKAVPKLGKFDFLIQLIGLLCSFAGLSLYQLISIAIDYAMWKVKKRKTKIALFCLKLAILLLSLAYCVLLCIERGLDYKAEWKNLTRIERTKSLVLPKIVHLAICVRIDRYVGNWYFKTMSQIERKTDQSLDDVLDGIYLSYHGRLLRTNYEVHSKVLFKDRFRCFSITIRPNYRITPANPKLSIKLKENSELYLLSEKEDLNQKSFQYSGRFGFRKKIVNSLKRNENCVDYQEKYANCTSRWNCIDRCISKRFLSKYHKITFGYFGVDQLVDKDWFTLTEWNTSNPLSNFGKTSTIYENIRTECLEAIPDEKACVEIEFEKISKFEKAMIGTYDELTEIDLQFDVVRSVEQRPSWYKLALDLVSIQGIFFGLTVLGSLKMLCSFIPTRENKIVFFLIYLFSSIGGSWHTYHIFNLIISGELTPSEHYELVKEVQLPVMVFCLQIDENLVDKNHKMTGNYLEELAGDVTAKRTFENIAYLNESNELTYFDLDSIEPFFLQKMKCFSINIDQKYNRDQFHFATESRVLEVNFIKERKVNKKNIHFMTKSKETKEFSKVAQLCYWGTYYWIPSFSITQETSLFAFEDRFSFIKQHFASSQEEIGHFDRHLLQLQSNKHNLKTLNLPLEAPDFRFELQEDLFEQLNSVELNRNKRTASNYQLLVNNHLKMVEKLGAQFTYNLAFLQKIVLSTNEENIGMLLLGLLNVLCIWFDLGVLDIHPVFGLSHDYFLVYLYLHFPVFLFDKISQFLLFSSKWLRKFELPLYELIDCRKRNSRETSRF